MIRGLSSWKRSQVKPCRSRTPGPKFSMTTSLRLTSASITALPLGDFRLTVMLRLFEFSITVNLKSPKGRARSEEHTSELQSHLNLVCRLLLDKKKNNRI